MSTGFILPLCAVPSAVRTEPLSLKKKRNNDIDWRLISGSVLLYVLRRVVNVRSSTICKGMGLINTNFYDNSVNTHVKVFLPLSISS